MKQRTVRFGVVGVKGFSQRHVSWIRRAATAGAPVEVAAVATIFDDPEARAAGEELAKNGAKVVKSYDDLLNLQGEIDIVTLPVGIHLHAPLAIKGLQAGFPVYMEKPAAGTVDEVAALMAAEKTSQGRLFVGFQTLYQPSTWVLKRRLLSGVVGKVKRIVTTMAWPRYMAYYLRNRWAGKVEVDGTFIYDCPMNNSAGHFLNVSLFLAGAREEESAVPIGVEAELYRATPTESADSTFCRFTTREGVDIVFNGTQACAEDMDATIDIVGEDGRITITDQEERVLVPWTIVDKAGNSRVEGDDIPKADVFARVAAAFLDPGMREISTLSTARMHTAANQMAFLSAAIHPVASEYIDHLKYEDGRELYAVKGMNAAVEKLRPEGLLPFESGWCPWSVKGGVSDDAMARRLLGKVGVQL